MLYSSPDTDDPIYYLACARGVTSERQRGNRMNCLIVVKTSRQPIHSMMVPTSCQIMMLSMKMHACLTVTTGPIA